jgi:hypothetical protein
VRFSNATAGLDTYASMNLRSALLGCSSSQLARIAAAWSLTLDAGTLRRELVELVAARIIAGVAEELTWSGLGEVERAVIGLLVRAGGRHEFDLLTRRLGRIEPRVADDDDRAAAIEQNVARLFDRGLLYRVFDTEEQRQGVYVVLPDEVMTAARQHLDDGVATLPPGATEAPERVARARLATDLFVLTSALRREAWGAASRGLAGQSSRTVGQILDRLRQLPSDGPGDPSRRWRFLLWLAQRAGWIGRGAWPTPDEETVERLLSDPGSVPELALAAGPAGDDGTRGRTERPVGRQRQADAMQLLSELDEACWWPIGSLVDWLVDEIAEDPGDRRAARRHRELGRLEAQLNRWLAGRWFWLGLVVWGWDGSAWSSVATTDALRALASGRRPTADQPPHSCLVAGHLQIEAFADADLATLYRAERYLAFGGGDADVRRYRLTPASFDRGVRLGGDADELRSLLGRLIGEAVPAEWLAAIDAWSKGSSRLSLSSRLLLASERAEVLAEALKIPAARDAVAETVSPRHALVHGERVADLLAELARAGLPVDVDPGLRAEPADLGRSAAMASGVAETAWMAIEVLRRLAPDVVAEQRDLVAARGRLDAVLASSVLEALNRRAAAIVAAIVNRRRPRTRRRVV